MSIGGKSNENQPMLPERELLSRTILYHEQLEWARVAVPAQSELPEASQVICSALGWQIGRDLPVVIAVQLLRPEPVSFK